MLAAAMMETSTSHFHAAIALLILFPSSGYGNDSNATTTGITLEVEAEKWQNLTFSGKRVLYSPTATPDLDLTCRAQFPIQWNFTGFIHPPEVVKWAPPKRFLDWDMFQIQITILPFAARNLLGAGASTRIACEKINDPEVYEEVFVFVRGINNKTVLFSKETTVMDSYVIPCQTKDPTIPTSLLKRTKDGSAQFVNDSSLEYIPSEGFRSRAIFNGTYTCRQGDEFVTITAEVSTSSNDHEISPIPSSVRAFTDETVEFSCSSKSGSSVKLIVDGNRTTYSTSSFAYIDLPSSASVTIFPPTPTVSLRSADYTPITKGRVACVEETQTGNGTENETLVKEWSYEFVEAPEIYLDNFSRDLHCLSSVTSKLVQTVRCKNHMHCHFMSRCLDNVTSCNFEGHKQFYSEKDTNCWIRERESTWQCNTIPYAHLNGIVQCNAGGLSKRWDYFVSLDFIEYTYWKDAPNNSLLRMDEVESVLHTNGSNTFFCVAVAYLFADSLSFEMELNNGSVILLEDNEVSVNISNPLEENARKIEDFNIIGILDIHLPIEAVRINCLAPWWNDTEIMRTSRKFETRHLMAPQIIVNGTNENVTKVTFKFGQNNRRLTCHAKGEPRPEYKWFFGNSSVADVFPELKMSVGSEYESNLEFPMIEKDEMDGSKYAGEYSCLATNHVDSAEQKFKLHIADEQNIPTSVLYKSIVSVVAILCVTLLAAFIFFLRKYRAAQALIRDLTDAEIDEFFQGKPELMDGAEGANLAIGDFLPYKNQYELPMKDMELYMSDLLGSGNFAYVVRGKILTTGLNVAVKISKSSADVNSFKSILSEVKIMMYIGKHENIVTLVGVCSEGIRNRSIYIATDICELGSLETFLRNSRTKFINLLQENELKLSLIPDHGEQNEILSTLDLIKFSFQIAQGMEYLSNKSIIHADLATRNVLLTSERIVKISDFGLSKKLYDESIYVKTKMAPLPWRWMAYESLTTLSFSTASDIWSFGVTLFEIFTLGDIPYPNEQWTNEFPSKLANGMRMGKPKYCTREIYSIIGECWENEPELRPSFTHLRTLFEEMVNKLSGTDCEFNEIRLGDKMSPERRSENVATIYENVFVGRQDPTLNPARI